MNEVDAIRLKQFRQLKREIRGSGDYLIVGIDVAKLKHNAFDTDLFSSIQPTSYCYNVV